MESAVSYLKCLSSYIEDDKYTNLIQDIDNAALEYEEVLTSPESNIIFEKYDNLYSILNEHITNLERYFPRFDIDEFIKTKLFTDDTINEEVLQNFEKKIIKYYLYEKYLFDFYGTVSLYTKITKNELAKQGIDYGNLLPQIVQKIDENELKPIKNEVTIYVYQNGKISEKFDSTLSRFSFKALMETSGFDWNAKGYDVNMELISKFKSLSAENEEEDEDSADVVLIESRTEEEKLLEEIISQIQSDEYKLSLSDFNFDDFELNLDILLDDKNNAYIQDFNLLFFILCVLVNYVRENTDDESSDGSLEIIENKINRAKKDVKDKLSKLGIKNIKGVLSSENAPKIFEGAIKVLPELSEIFDKETGEKREIYYSVLGDVFADDFKILTKGDEKDYKNIDVEISSLAQKTFKEAASISEKPVVKKVEKEESAKQAVSTQKENVVSVKRVEPKVNYKKNDNNTQSVQDEEKKEDKKISGGTIAGIVLGVTGAIGLVVGSYFIYKNCCSNTNVVDSDVVGENGVSNFGFLNQNNNNAIGRGEVNPEIINVGRNNNNNNLNNNSGLLGDNGSNQNPQNVSEDNYNNDIHINPNRNVNNVNGNNQNPNSQNNVSVEPSKKSESSNNQSEKNSENPEENKENGSEGGNNEQSEQSDNVFPSLSLFGVTVREGINVNDYYEYAHKKSIKLNIQYRTRLKNFFNGECDQNEVFPSDDNEDDVIQTMVAKVVYSYCYKASVRTAMLFARYRLGLENDEIDSIKDWVANKRYEKNDDEYCYVIAEFHNSTEKDELNDIFDSYDFREECNKYEPFFNPKHQTHSCSPFKVPKYMGYYKFEIVSKSVFDKFSGAKFNLKTFDDSDLIESIEAGNTVYPSYKYQSFGDEYIGFSPLLLGDEYDKKALNSEQGGYLYLVQKILFFVHFLNKLKKHSGSNDKNIKNLCQVFYNEDYSPFIPEFPTSILEFLKKMEKIKKPSKTMFNFHNLLHSTNFAVVSERRTFPNVENVNNFRVVNFSFFVTEPAAIYGNTAILVTNIYARLNAFIKAVERIGSESGSEIENLSWSNADAINKANLYLTTNAGRYYSSIKRSNEKLCANDKYQVLNDKDKKFSTIIDFDWLTDRHNINKNKNADDDGIQFSQVNINNENSIKLENSISKNFNNNASTSKLLNNNELLSFKLFNNDGDNPKNENKLDVINEVNNEDNNNDFKIFDDENLKNIERSIKIKNVTDAMVSEGKKVISKGGLIPDEQSDVIIYNNNFIKGNYNFIDNQ